MLTIYKKTDDYCLFSGKTDDASFESLKINLVSLLEEYYNKYKKDTEWIDISRVCHLREILNNNVYTISRDVMSTMSNVNNDKYLQYIGYSFRIFPLLAPKIDIDTTEILNTTEVQIELNILNGIFAGAVFLKELTQSTINSSVLSGDINNRKTVGFHTYYGERGQEFFLMSLKIHNYEKYVEYYNINNRLLPGALHFDDLDGIKLMISEKETVLELPVGIIRYKEPLASRFTTLRKTLSLRHLLHAVGITVDRRGWKKDFFDRSLDQVNWQDLRFTQFFVSQTFKNE